MEADGPVPHNSRKYGGWQILASLMTGIVLFLLSAVAAVAVLFMVVNFSGRWDAPETAAVSVSVTPTVLHTVVLAAYFPTSTPFQPKTPTPTSTRTPTPTATATALPTSTLLPTATALPTSTPLPTDMPSSTPSDTPVTQSDTPSNGLPNELPPSASISGIVGFPQSLPLSCESRSAADFARFFGLDIGELDFQNGLPRTDNPNTGFVGNPNAERGQVPPNSYGVHAEPVAALLRAYGLNAYGYSGLSVDDLRREIASGQPVIAWVIGNVWRGSGVSYTAADGETLVVAPFEHTVIVTGYTLNSISVVDGNLVYSTDLDRFLDSWGVLGNLAVIVE
jgi:uncharacterized protein YvpB